MALWTGRELVEAVLAGQLKSAVDRRHTNLLAVGDEVDTEPGQSNPYRVVSLRERRTRLERPTNDPRGRTQVIAANATHVVIVSSIAEPAFRPGLVDRWGLLARRGGLHPILCLNKTDLGTAEDVAHALEEAAVPFDHVCVSARAGDGIERLREILIGTTTVFVGHSGVGKSSLLHALLPDIDAQTGELSVKSGKGKHTTTSARLYHLPEGGMLIDTPGVRSVSLGRAEASEVAAVFAEIADAPPCRFRTCTHRAEPGCSVLEGLESGTVPKIVYHRYRRLLEEVEVP
ncbi:MAG TPA: ribosome small subunit-dependent GTPase A [Candidatus Eisenbacteria bacterium]|nr:ribosome small subunit-dependent GTPase A [Candidatus Eisenbacteria bacterium]